MSTKNPAFRIKHTIFDLTDNSNIVCSRNVGAVD